MVSATNIVRLESVSVAYGATTILQSIDLQIEHARLTAIMGPSGCGKTPLLRTMTGQVGLSAGKLQVFDTPLSHTKPSVWQPLRLQMGMLFQSGALLSDYSVFDNVALPLRQHTALTEQAIRDLVLMRLASVGMLHAAQKLPNELSGGMARRAALARALIMDPKLLLLDEPFAGQDPETLRSLMALFRRTVDTLGVAAVLVSHDIQEALEIADYVYVLAAGKVAAAGTPAEIHNSQLPLVRSFLGDGPEAVPLDALPELLA